MFEDDPWLQPIQPQQERKIPIWAWIGGAVIFAICGVISVGALFIFLTNNVNNEGQVVVQNTAVATEVVVADPPTPTEEIVVVDPANEPTEEVTAEPVITPSPIPSNTATAEPEPTAMPTPSPSPTPSRTPPIVRSVQLGLSTEDRPINLINVGNGRRHIVIVGALHGNEPGTQELVTQLADHFEENPELVRPNYTLHFIPNLNPDGLVRNSRYTSNGVDINRNWDTPNWVKEAPQPDGTTNSGGGIPFSEPETALLHDFFQTLQDDAQSINAIIVHAHTGVTGTGRVQPGYIQPGSPVNQSINLTNALIDSGGYVYTPTCCGSYIPTGEISNWLAINGISAVDLELPSGGWPNQLVEGRTILQRAIDNVLELMG